MWPPSTYLGTLFTYPLSSLAAAKRGGPSAAALGQPGGPSGGCDVDVGALLEQWVCSLEQCCPLVESLAGQGQGASWLCVLGPHFSSIQADLLNWRVCVYVCDGGYWQTDVLLSYIIHSHMFAYRSQAACTTLL
jgi:hypothetical protein